jgi:hypothetical protein
MSSEIRELLRADWVDNLLDYGINEIDKAISQYVDDVKNRKAPHEGQIKAIIISNRAADVAAQPKAPEPSREPPATKEQAAAIMAQIGFTPKTFGG